MPPGAGAALGMALSAARCTWILARLVFRALAMSEGAYRRRYLAAKYFSALTSSRRARRSYLAGLNAAQRRHTEHCREVPDPAQAAPGMGKRARRERKKRVQKRKKRRAPRLRLSAADFLSHPDQTTAGGAVGAALLEHKSIGF